MGKLLSHSHVQNKVLIYLEHNEIVSLAGLAVILGVHRSSVSRAIHALYVSELVEKINNRWNITLAGKKEAQLVRERLSDRTIKATAKIIRLIDQSRLATSRPTVATEITGVYSPISKAAELSLNSVTQEAVQSLVSAITHTDSYTVIQNALQPVMHAAARVDLLTTTEEVMSSLVSIIGKVGEGLTFGSKQPLLNVASNIGLLASAQDAMQSVTSVASSIGLPWMNKDLYQPLANAAEIFGSFASARDAIQPLIDATARYDTFVLADEAIQSLLHTGKESFSSTKVLDAIQPLVNAANRFDLVFLGLETAPFSAKVFDIGDLLTSSTRHYGVLTDHTDSIKSGLSVFGLTTSMQLTSTLEGISAISLKPTITEITARLAIEAKGYYSHNSVTDLYPRLVQEALTSFSHSHRIGLASIEQMSGFGTEVTSIIKDFDEVNLQLSDIVGNIGAITGQSYLKTHEAAIFPNLAEVARTYRGYFADIVSGLGSSFNYDNLSLGIVVPTTATSAYVDSVSRAIVAVQPHNEIPPKEAISISWKDRGRQVDYVFESLGANFDSMWKGSWMVLDGNSPDRIRQSAHSGRELIIQMLDTLAPDSAFSSEEIAMNGYQNRVTRKMRINKIMGNNSRSASSLVSSLVTALDEMYSGLTAVSHDHSISPQATEQQLTGLLFATGGLLSFVAASRHNNPRNS